MLQRPEFLIALLNQAKKKTEVWKPYRGEYDYFEYDFLKMSASERKIASGPVTNKLEEMVNNRYLRAMLCGDRDDLDLRSLWERPRILLVHLDKDALGADGSRILGALLINALYNTAMSQSGRIPVMLSLDEIGLTGRSLGSGVTDILAAARSQNLRLLFASQFMNQLGSELKEALRTSNGFQAYFHLGPPDAKEVSETMPVNRGTSVEKISIDLQKDEKRFPYTYAVRNAQGDRIAVSEFGWQYLYAVMKKAPDLRTKTELYEVFWAVMMKTGLNPNEMQLYNPDNPSVSVPVRHLTNLNPEEWWFTSAEPLRVSVYLPKLKVTQLRTTTSADRRAELSDRLKNLAKREALIKTETGHRPGCLCCR